MKTSFLAIMIAVAAAYVQQVITVQNNTAENLRRMKLRHREYLNYKRSEELKQFCKN